MLFDEFSRFLTSKELEEELCAFNFELFSLFLSMIFPFPSGVTLLKFNCQAGLALLRATCVGCLSGLAPGATRQRKG